MSGDAGNAETGTLLQRHAFGKLNHLLQGNDGVLGGGSERSIRLSAVAPDAATDPLTRHAVTDCVNSARTVAVRYDTRVRHPDAKRILAFLHIARIDA